MSKLSRRLLLMSLIGFFLAALSCAVNAEGKFYFIWLYFYAPILWLLWIVVAFVSRNRKEGIYLFVAWWVIDLMILITMLSLSLEPSKVGQSKGADVLMLIAYFPSLFPTIFLVHSLASSALLAQFSTFIFGESSAAGVWFEVSMYAAIQSVVIFGIARLSTFRHHKMRNGA